MTSFSNLTKRSKLLQVLSDRVEKEIQEESDRINALFDLMHMSTSTLEYVESNDLSLQ
jgi:hypothetical protein